MQEESQAIRSMIERLVAFDTTSCRSNLELIDWVEDYLRSFGLKTRRTYDGERRKANLFATLGPEVAGGVVLSGHSDVVPVAGQDWSSDPFTVTERDGRLYGRGTADMKSFLAIALALVPRFRELPLERPLHFALSYDEEVGCVGVGGLIRDLTENLPHPAVAIIGEPTEMRVVTAHKCVAAYRTRVTGRPAHSSQPHRGGSAIIAAARMIVFLGELAEEKRRAAEPDSGFEPPYTTFQIGTVEGGTALNIIPAHCSFLWEFRALPSDSPQEIIARVRRHASEIVLPSLSEFAPEAEIAIEQVAWVPALSPESEGTAEALARRITGANQSHVVSFGTEGGLFQEAGISTVVCGPGSIDQAHQPDEFIALEQVELCRRFLVAVADWAAGRSGGEAALSGSKVGAGQDRR